MRQLSETPAQLVAAGLEWHVILSDGAVISAVATSRAAGGLFDIERLVVDPAHHRRGLGRTLLGSVIEEAAVVVTGRAKAPARLSARSPAKSLSPRHSGGHPRSAVILIFHRALSRFSSDGMSLMGRAEQAAPRRCHPSADKQLDLS